MPSISPSPSPSFRLPSISPSSSPSGVLAHSSTNWPSFNWSTFAPDLIAGLLTGAVVGLILYHYQRRRDAVQAQEAARRVSSRLVQPLLLAIQRPVHLPRYSQIEEIPRKVSRALGIIEGEDVDYLHETATTELTSQLLRFRSAAWDFREDARDLAQAIRRWCKNHAPVSGEILEYAEARIMDAPSQYMISQFPDAQTRRGLESQSQELLSNHFVKLHASRYRKAQRRTQQRLEELEEALIQEIRRRKSMN